MKTNIKSIISIFLPALLLVILFSACGDKTEPQSQEEFLPDSKMLLFSGYVWEKKETKNIADSRYFCLTKNENVSMDDTGNLILRLKRHENTWYGGEITIDTSLGYGEYSFSVRMRSGGLDANAALAFTILNVTDDFYEGMTQTGVRFSKYFENRAPNELEYFLYATDKKFAEVQTPDKPFLLSEVESHHKVGIYPNYIYYSSKSSGGFYNEFKALKKSGDFHIQEMDDALTFSEPSDNLKVIISLCLPEANEPKNLKDIEVIISKFKYSPHVSDLTKR
ncbi:MAG: hypothetical protein KIT33_11035 [Candidatus Kapabacteria bacterium]|nr:hypothetical protein [Ignavibacteriota bacterium]MCW5885491.1 hypothetical protein [Candidatus Kapabacteria bacterium]